MAELPKRLGKKLVRQEGGGLKRTEKKKPQRIGADLRRQPLSFIEPAPNPMQGFLKDGTPEEVMSETQQRLQKGFIERSKAEAKRFSETTRSDYYCTVVFEHGDQRAAFLKQAGYRETDSYFVDGMMLAAALGIELPPSPFKLRTLRSADKSLQHLVTSIPKRSEIKKSPD